MFFFFFQAEDGIRDADVTGVQTCALPIYPEVREGAPEPPRWHEQRRERDARHGGGQRERQVDERVQEAAARKAVARQRRSEERRVGKECRSRWSREREERKDEDAADKSRV